MSGTVNAALVSEADDLRGESLSGVVDVHPVADLENTGTSASMKSRRADDDTVEERSDHDVAASFPFRLPLVDQRHSIA